MSATAPKETRAGREGTALGAGLIADACSNNVFFLWMNPVFNMTLGLSPALISTVVLIQRLVDALLAPIFGQFSDNLRTRWGRRRPMLAVLALPLALSFLAIWWFPGGLSGPGLFWYLLGTSLVFYAIHAAYAVPIAALVVEAAPAGPDRTRLIAISQVTVGVASVGLQWLLPLAQLPVFGGMIPGVRLVAIGAAAVFLCMALLPVIFVRERLYTSVVAGQRKTTLRESVAALRANPHFLALLGVRFSASTGYGVVAIFGLYLNTYLVHGGDIGAAASFYGWLGSMWQLSAIGSVWLCAWLARRLGKFRTLRLALFILICASAAKLLLYAPGHPWWQLVVFAANGAGMASLNLVIISLLADVADEDEWRTGRRREALYASLVSWVDKLGSSFGGFLSGFLLVWIGFDAKLGGSQPLPTLPLMQWLYAAVPFVGALIALACAKRIRLGEDKMSTINADLAARRLAPAVS